MHLHGQSQGPCYVATNSIHLKLHIHELLCLGNRAPSPPKAALFEAKYYDTHFAPPWDNQGRVLVVGAPPPADKQVALTDRLFRAA